MRALILDCCEVRKSEDLNSKVHRSSPNILWYLNETIEANQERSTPLMKREVDSLLVGSSVSKKELAYANDDKLKNILKLREWIALCGPLKLLA